MKKLIFVLFICFIGIIFACSDKESQEQNSTDTVQTQTAVPDSNQVAVDDSSLTQQ